MREEHFPRWLLKVHQPLEQPSAIRMPGHAKDLLDSRRDMILAAMNPNLFFARQQMAPKGPFGLKANEQNCGFGPGNIVAEVMFDATRVTHSRRRHDDAGLFTVIDRFGFISGSSERQSGKMQR